MKVLIGCESSGTVRDAFIRAGYDALSCDLLATTAPGPHYQGNIEDLLGEYWDLFIVHPTCTFLCSSGLHWNHRVAGRQAKTDESLQFVRRLFDAHARGRVGSMALENPVGCISTRIEPATQYIQPHQFGHDASKKTGLWLRNLPKLQPTIAYPPRIVAAGSYAGKQRWGNQTDSGQNKLGPSAERWQVRSETYQGIADAMAAQWGAAIGQPSPIGKLALKLTP